MPSLFESKLSAVVASFVAVVLGALLTVWQAESPAETCPNRWTRSESSGWRAGTTSEVASSCASVLERPSPDRIAAMELREFQKPVLLEGWAENLTSEHAWTSEELAQRLGKIQFRLSHPLLTAIFGPDFGDVGEMSFQEYLSSMKNMSQDLELFTNGRAIPHLTGEVFTAVSRPGWHALTSNGVSYHDVFSFGPRGTGLALHAHGLAWLGQLHGRKQFRLLPPQSNLTGLPVKAYHEGFYKLLSAWADETAAAFDNLPGSSTCVLMPGDIIVVPPFWYHATANLDEAVAIGGQSFGRELTTDWNEETEAAFNGVDDVAELIANMGRIRRTFAKFYLQEGDSKLALKNGRAAIKHLYRAAKRHPINLGVLLAAIQTGAEFAETKKEHAYVAQQLRRALQNLAELHRDGLLQNGTYVALAHHFVTEYVSKYEGPLQKEMKISMEELEETLGGLKKFAALPEETTNL